MADQSAYVAAEQSGGLEIEVERLRQQALLAWDKETRTLELFGLRDGMSVLELGAGPGFITEQLLKRYPSSHVTVIELDPVMIERSTQYLQGKFDDRLSIVQGSVMQTDLPDNTFDFAYGRLIFQHLPDPLGAAKEVLRVLKPGGGLVIFDIDEASHIFDPKAPPEAEAIFQRFLAAHAAKGGNRYIGRKLPRLLKQAGYTNVDLELLSTHSDIQDLEAMDMTYRPDAWKPDLEAGLISQQEFEMLSDFDKEFFAGDPIISLVLFMACGKKPAESA